MEANFYWPPFSDLKEGSVGLTYDWSPSFDAHEGSMQTPCSASASVSGTQPTSASSELQQGSYAGAVLGKNRDDKHFSTPQPFDQAIQAALANLENEASLLNQHICFVPGCKKNQFTREADLQRHIKTVHVRDEAFYCEVEGCPRHEHAPGGQRSFPRKDKMKEHMRTVHRNLGY
ncbi:hypothetical protein W97_01236 [Coniosporium apollinis CBS 100218]|uniref:C2H2-type domain-containing protein n=1 Tax=Coniosporium apollinis (strain CBS 100218) TaxID=1168221 RepID=R7YJB6_CONA1|nr:uncharacterized protein W97_01236 [Coniosporium apollinis CBS 100218]EON62017.1 hypothetical protein W97_01236 [Coniosporium apollinis CBS 100218]